jgi:hypothetical protein
VHHPSGDFNRGYFQWLDQSKDLESPEKDSKRKNALMSGSARKIFLPFSRSKGVRRMLSTLVVAVSFHCIFEKLERIFSTKYLENEFSKHFETFSKISFSHF